MHIGFTITADLLDWLMTRANPIVRYRTARELLGQRRGLDHLRSELLAVPLVRLWLDRLRAGRIHNGKATDFENVIHKLVELGLHRGIAEFDSRIQHYLDWLSDSHQSSCHGMMAVLNRSIVTGGLACAGYAHVPAVRKWLLRRLDDLAAATAAGTYDIYLLDDACADLPKAYRGRHPVLKPQFAPGGELQLPYIHDLYGLAQLSPDARPDTQAKLDQVIRYILAPRYQHLHPGYGYVRDDHDDRPHYRVLGWAARLPGRDARLVQRTELLAHFRPAANHRWFKQTLSHLLTFRTPQGTWLFPREYLLEKKEGYWVGGALMGLWAHPRDLEVESTFRMLKIRHAAQ